MRLIKPVAFLAGSLLCIIGGLYIAVFIGKIIYRFIRLFFVNYRDIKALNYKGKLGLGAIVGFRKANGPDRYSTWR
jgi:hypothetical protein